jgi:hypothetical protein
VSDRLGQAQKRKESNMSSSLFIAPLGSEQARLQHERGVIAGMSGSGENEDNSLVDSNLIVSLENVHKTYLLGVNGFVTFFFFQRIN